MSDTPAITDELLTSLQEAWDDYLWTLENQPDNTIRRLNLSSFIGEHAGPLLNEVGRLRAATEGGSDG